jgi:hypothetical protein
MTQILQSELCVTGLSHGKELPACKYRPFWVPSKFQGSEMPSLRPIVNKECVERLFHSSYPLSQSNH